MGAVNCGAAAAANFIGENTDGKGFLNRSPVVDPRRKSVVLFGAGGAARAIAVELGLAGVKKMTVVNRSPERGGELVDLLRHKLRLELIRSGPAIIPCPAGDRGGHQRHLHRSL